MKTLIIVDMQNDFMPKGALAVPKGDSIIPVINSLQPSFDLVAATQDWHPENHLSFAANHGGKNIFDTVCLRGTEQILWPVHCVQNTPGAAFHADLDTTAVEAFFRKGMDTEIDSYSGFYDNGHKKSTGLAGYLREKNAHELYFCGLAADICVYYTLCDALEEGFSVHLITDAVMPLKNEEFAQQLTHLQEKGVHLTKGEQL